MKLAIAPYKMASQSARALAKNMGIKGIRVEGSKYKSRAGKDVINWGISKEPDWYGGEDNILNKFSSVDNAADKLKALTIMEAGGVSVPEFTTDIPSILQDEKFKEGEDRYIGRTLLRGSGGDGCTFLSLREGDPDFLELEVDTDSFKLATKYIPKSAEYRVHVFRGEVFDVTQKKVRKDSLISIDYKIRSHENGWIFCREGIEVPDSVNEEALKAVAALDLDFGAVDIIWNRNKGTFVLEVNTAPGLEGTTLAKYTQTFKDHYGIVGE